MKPLNLEPHRARCIRCGANIIWTISAHTGADIPVNERPNGTGANLLLFADGPAIKAGVLSRGQAGGARERGSTLYVSHYHECRNTKTHRTGLR